MDPPILVTNCYETYDLVVYIVFCRLKAKKTIVQILPNKMVENLIDISLKRA